MKRLAGIILGTPADLGPAIADYRAMLGLTRDQLAQQIAARTGGSQTSALAQLRRWETGDKDPTLESLGPVLDVLGADLALIPRAESDTTDRRTA